MLTASSSLHDCAARLAAIPAGEILPTEGISHCCSYIQRREGNRSVESLEVKVPEGWGVPV